MKTTRRKTTTKRVTAKKPTVRGLKKVCSGVVKATGLKADGTLKKGFKYIAGGKIVKVAPKPVAKKKPVTKKKPLRNKRK